MGGIFRRSAVAECHRDAAREQHGEVTRRNRGDRVAPDSGRVHAIAVHEDVPNFDGATHGGVCRADDGDGIRMFRTPGIQRTADLVDDRAAQRGVDLEEQTLDARLAQAGDRRGGVDPRDISGLRTSIGHHGDH